MSILSDKIKSSRLSFEYWILPYSSFSAPNPTQNSIQNVFQMPIDQWSKLKCLNKSNRLNNDFIFKVEGWISNTLEFSLFDII